MGDFHNLSSIEVIGNVNTPSNVVIRGGIDCCGSNYWLFAGMRVVSTIGHLLRKVPSSVPIMLSTTAIRPSSFTTNPSITLYLT